MSYVRVQELLAKTGSLYKLVILAAMRAQELSNGATRLIDDNNTKFASIALEEIAQGKVRLEKGK